MSLTTLTFANNVLPVANITSSTGSFSAKIGQTFTFSGASSYDPDGGGINYYWWYVDGVQKKAGSTASSFTYDPGIVGNGSTNRTFQLMLKVRDNEYSTKTKTVTVTIQADKRNYFVTDHLGNVRATVDQNGAVIGYDDFYPYGQVMPGRSSNTANANDIYKFTGHERDAELGLDYMLARNYDPEIGRFLSVDPLFDKYPGLSPYVYVKGNPIRLIDPDGRAALDPFLVTVRSYIPYKSVGGFKGDNRNSSTSMGVTSRTSHSVGVETNPEVSRNPEISNDMGTTGVTATSFGVPPHGIPLIGKAPNGIEGGFSATVSRNSENGGDNAVLNFSGSSRNPLTPGAPKIDYNFSIEIIPGKDGGAPTVKVSGSHDGFPAYEINVTDINSGAVYQIYHDTPNSKFELIRLVGEGDTKVSNE